MNQYSIKDLEKLSGIKAHTIRIWESRYQALSPKRTDTNIRYYTDSDVKKLMNFGLLNQNGLKISLVAKMSEAELKKEVELLLDSPKGHTAYINQFLSIMLDLDENQFNKIFLDAVNKFGFEETMVDIFYPLLNKIGLMWRVDKVSPAHEHFVSNLVRNKLIVGIDTLSQAEVLPSETRIVMYLPAHEMHEMALLYYYYLVKKQGVQVFYLGQRVPTLDLIEVIKEVKPDFIFSSWVLLQEKEVVDEHFSLLKENFPDLGILVGGNVLEGSQYYEKIENPIQMKQAIQS